MIRRDSVQTLLNEIASRYRAGVEFQLSQLSNIMHGEYTKSTIYKTYDKDGELIRTQEVVSKPSARDITSAINLISKLTGQQDAMRINANAMSGELKRLYRAHTAEKPRRSKANAEAVEADGAGGDGVSVDIVTPTSLSDEPILTRGSGEISDLEKNSVKINEQGDILCKDGSRKGKRGGARVKRPLTERIKANGLSPRGSRAKEGEITVKVDSVDSDGNVASGPDLSRFSAENTEVADGERLFGS